MVFPSSLLLAVIEETQGPKRRQNEYLRLKWSIVYFLWIKNTRTSWPSRGILYFSANEWIPFESIYNTNNQASPEEKDMGNYLVPTCGLVFMQSVFGSFVWLNKKSFHICQVSHSKGALKAHYHDGWPNMKKGQLFGLFFPTWSRWTPVEKTNETSGTRLAPVPPGE